MGIDTVELISNAMNLGVIQMRSKEEGQQGRREEEEHKILEETQVKTKLQGSEVTSCIRVLC